MHTKFIKILRDVRTRKMRTALVAISIFIGVFGTITLLSMGDLIVRQLEDDIDPAYLPMVRADVTLAPGVNPDNDAVFDALLDYPGVTAVTGRAVREVSWKDGDRFRRSYVAGHADPLDDMQLEPLRLVDGAFPVSGQHEIAVERRFAEENGFSAGDTITLRMVGAESGITEADWTIAGIVFMSYPLSVIEVMTPADMLFASYEDVRLISGLDGLTKIDTRMADATLAEAEADAFTAYMSQHTPYIPAYTMVEDPAEHPLISFAQTTGTVMASLAAIALLVSGFLALNVVTAVVTEQKAQIGTMKAIGATRLDNFMMYTGIALVYGIIGVIPGVLLGIPAGYYACKAFADMFFITIDGFDYSLRAILFGAGMGLAVPVLAAVVPVLSSTRVTIIDALTDRGISSRYGDGPVARAVGRLPLPVTVRQGLSDLLRKKWRILLTGITLTVAAGSFMGIYAAFTSLNAIMNDIFDSWDYEFMVMPARPQDGEAVAALIEENYPGLRSKGVYSTLAIEVDGYAREVPPMSGPEGVIAEGFDPGVGSLALNLEQGVGLGGNPQGVIASAVLAEEVGVGLGDTLTIHAGGNVGTFKIIGLASYPFDYVWFEWQTLSELAGLVDPAGNPVPTGILWSMADMRDPSADDVTALTDEISELLLANGYPVSFMNTVATEEEISNAVTAFGAIFNFTALLVALVGAVGLISTLSMSVFERQKEIGVMRSIGASSWAIISQFLTEGVVVGLAAWIVGLPLSFFLSKWLITALQWDRYDVAMPPVALVVGLVGMVLITVLASLWPSITAARKTVSDILRYQ